MTSARGHSHESTTSNPREGLSLETRPFPCRPSGKQGQQQTPAVDRNQATNAEWGSQTLRQACCRENPESAMCVQNFNDSRGLAIRITYRISLRSSSLWEPRHPPLKVVLDYSSQGGRQIRFEAVLYFRFRS